MKLQVAVPSQTFRVAIAVVTVDFVPMANHILCAISFAAAVGSCVVVAVRILLTALVTVQKVGTLLLRAAPRVAFKVIITVIFLVLFSQQTLIWVDTRIVGAAEGGVDAVIIDVAQDLSGNQTALAQVHTGSIVLC